MLSDTLQNPPDPEQDLQRIFQDTVAQLDSLKPVTAAYRDGLKRAIANLRPEDISGQTLFDTYKSIHTIPTTLLPLLDLDPKQYPHLQHLGDFYLHDIGHLRNDGILYSISQVESTLADESGLPADVRQHIYNLMQTIPEGLALVEYPGEFIRELIRVERGSDLRTEAFDLEKVIQTVAHHVNQRDMLLDFTVTTPESRQLERHEIVVDCESLEAHSSQPCITAVLHNLIKNPYKMIQQMVWEAVEAAGSYPDGLPFIQRFQSGLMPERPHKIYVMGRNIPSADAIIIHIADTGEGLKIDDLLKSLRKLYKRGLLEQNDVGGVYELMKAWSENDYTIGNAKIGDIFEAAYLPQVSGFAVQDDAGASSGLGLWGSRLLAEKLGGKIVSTNRFEGGALFTVILPRNPLERGKTITPITTVTDELYSGLSTASFPAGILSAA